MAKSRKKLNKFLTQLRDAQYLEIDDAIINVINKKTKNTVLSIDIFSDYEHDAPYEEEIESIEGEYLQTIEEEVDKTTSEYRPMIVINKEITEDVKSPAIDEATGEQIYDRDGNALYNIEEETRTEEVVIDTSQVITESIYIPPSINYNEGTVVVTPVEKIEPGSWYYIKLQLEEAFKLNDIKKAVEEFEKMAPVVIGMPVKTKEDTTENIYYTLADTLEIHRNAIKNCPNTFWADGDILHIGSFGDGKFEFKVKVNGGYQPGQVIYITDIIDPATGQGMQVCDRRGRPIKYIVANEDDPDTITLAIVIDENGTYKFVQVDKYVDDQGKTINNRGLQKVLYYNERTIQNLIDTYKNIDPDGDDADYIAVYNLLSSWDKEDDIRYVDYVEGSTFNEGSDEFEDEYWKYYNETGQKLNNMILLDRDEHGNYIAAYSVYEDDPLGPYAHGYKFRKGDIKQVRQGGTFDRYSQEDIDEELQKALEEAKKSGKDLGIIQNAYAKINVGDFKAWSNITSKNAKDYWNDYLAKMSINTDTVKDQKTIEHKDDMHFYKVHVAYIKCMTKILINLKYAEWSAAPKKYDKTYDTNYIIETDLDSIASIELSEVIETLETVIDNANDLNKKLDQCIYGYTKYSVDSFPGFQSQYDETRRILSDLLDFADYYWSAYKGDPRFNVSIEENAWEETSIVTKVTKAKSKDKKVSTEKYYPKNTYGVYHNTTRRTMWTYDRGMFLYYIMMYQAKFFYCVVLKTIIDIIKQVQEYLSFSQEEYDKFIRQSLFTTKAKKGEMVNDKDVLATDKKGKKYSRKSNSWRKVNRKLKQLFNNHFITYYRLILDLFDLDDYTTNEFMIAFNNEFKAQIIEYENVPKDYIITHKATIDYYQGDRSKDYARQQ